MEYRIKRNAYVDEHGKERSHHYTVQYYKTILWGLYSYWKTECHEEGDMSGTYNSDTTFKTEENAIEFAENILCKGKVRDGHTSSVVSNGTCKPNIEYNGN